MPIDMLAATFSGEIIVYLRKWIKMSHATDLDFHYYRMKLLANLDDTSTSDKLSSLLNKVNFKHKFDMIEVISDKSMGELTARFIFSKILIALNEEYKKILEYEADRVNAETNSLLERISGLKTKISHH